MIAAIYLVVVLLVSAGIGYVYYRRDRGLSWAWVISVGLLLAFVLMAASGIVFLYAGLSYPAADDPRFTRTNSIYIDRANPIPGQVEPQHSEVLLQFPFEVRKGGDFEVRLTLSAAPAPIAPGEYASTLQGPKVLELRSQRNCPSTTADQSTACVRLERAANQISLVWDITPTAEADPTVRVGIPSFWPISSDWQAAIKFDGEGAVYSPTPGCERSRWIGEEGSCLPVLPLMLDERNARFELTRDTPRLFRVGYAHRGAEIDLETRQLRFPIRVTTSLGLDSNTYAWLALLGTLLSGFLGTGWAWKLVELFKPKPAALAAAGAGAATQPAPSPPPEPMPPTPAPANRGNKGKRRR